VTTNKCQLLVIINLLSFQRTSVYLLAYLTSYNTRYTKFIQQRAELDLSYSPLLFVCMVICLISWTVGVSHIVRT